MKLCKFFRNYNIFKLLNSGLNNVFACMENKMAACSPDDRLLYDTATSSAMFLCTKGKQGTALYFDIKFISFSINFLCIPIF